MNIKIFKNLNILSALKKSFSNLNTREKGLAITAIVVFFVVMLDVLLITPLYKNSERMKKEIKDYKSELVQMERLYDEHLRYKAVLRGNEGLPADFSIMTYLEGIANTVGVSYDSVQPRTSADNSYSYIDIRLKKITLYQLTNLLYNIEIGGKYPLRVKKLDIRTSYENKSLLDVGMQIVISGKV